MKKERRKKGRKQERKKERVRRTETDVRKFAQWDITGRMSFPDSNKYAV